jgi:hypothetical protein
MSVHHEPQTLSLGSWLDDYLDRRIPELSLHFGSHQYITAMSEILTVKIYIGQRIQLSGPRLKSELGALYA